LPGDSEERSGQGAPAILGRIEGKMMIDETELCRAIHEHKRLKFLYRGAERVVEPYAYGVSDGGHPVLRAYQVRGESPSRVPAWKLFHLEEMSDFALLDETFDEPQQGYMRNDPTMTKIYCEL
jgi:predicted DNA-binding transcriptional regulator YafY